MVHGRNTLRKMLARCKESMGGKHISKGLQVIVGYMPPQIILHWNAGLYLGSPLISCNGCKCGSYFGIIESMEKWIEETHQYFRGRWAHFIASSLGYTLGYAR